MAVAVISGSDAKPIGLHHRWTLAPGIGLARTRDEKFFEMAQVPQAAVHALHRCNLQRSEQIQGLPACLFFGQPLREMSFISWMANAQT
jgi:hypothetical protein